MNLQEIKNTILDGPRLIDGSIIKAIIEEIASGGVTSISVVNANGVSATITNPTTTPALTFFLGNITPQSIVASGSIRGSNLSGTNTGDQTIMLTGDVSGVGTGSFATTVNSIGGQAVSLGGSFTLSGSFSTILTVTGSTNVTLPTSGTLVNSAVTTLSSLATIGTITSGTWNGTTVGTPYGGTGQTTYSNGQLLIGNNTGGLTKATLTAGTGITVTNTSGAITIASSAPGGTVTNVSGTSGFITVSNGTTTPVITIDPTYVGQTSITTLGTVTTGAWNGTTVGATYGGTGVNNGSSTITIGGNFSVSGSFTTALTVTANTTVTLPITGTLATLAGTESLSNKALTASTFNGGSIGLVTPVQAQQYYTVNAQTGTTYTFGLLDNGALVTASNSSAQTYTIPANGTTALPVGARIDIISLGTGIVTISPAGGVTLESKGSKVTLTGQYSPATIVQVSANTWVLMGDLA